MNGGLLLLARRSLLRNRVRLIASIGGVGLALSLVLTLNAIVDGVTVQLTSYIDNAHADVWVAQSGVRNLHMSASWLPASVASEVRRVPGVAEATPIAYATEAIGARNARKIAYVIGLPPGAPIGLPSGIREGKTIPGPGEAVVGEDFARQAGIGLGDTVTIFGLDLRIAGISVDQSNLVNTIAFVSLEDFDRARGAQAVSFVLVRTAANATPDAVAASIGAGVRGVTAMTGAAFAEEERRLVMAMAGDVITMMNAIGFAVGLAVLALTVYIATLAGRREYGLLKAVGASGRFLYGVVLAQAAISVALGFALAVVVSEAVGGLVAVAGLPVSLLIEPLSLARAGGVAVVIAALASVLPVRQVAAIDPAIVFRRGVAQ